MTGKTQKWWAVWTALFPLIVRELIMFCPKLFGAQYAIMSHQLRVSVTAWVWVWRFMCEIVLRRVKTEHRVSSGGPRKSRPFYTVNWQISNRAHYLSRFSLPTVTVHLQAALQPTSTPASLILMPCLTQLVSYPLSLMPALFLLLASHLWLSILMYGGELPEYKLQWIWNHLLSITVLMDLYLHFERM